MVKADKILLDDPLSDISRKERRNLICISAIGILIEKLDLVPTKISALGIEFSQANQDTLLLIIGITILYFMCAFFIYGTTDFMRWKLVFADERRKIVEGTREKEMAKHINRTDELIPPEGYDNLIEKIDNEVLWIGLCTKGVSLVRISFEFSLPLAIGVYGASLVLF